jgi:hypothetical protein
MVAAVQGELERAFPGNAPPFLRTPYGWHDRAEVERTVRAGGFERVSVEAVERPSVAATAAAGARAFLVGTPLTAELAERGGDVEALAARAGTVLREKHGEAPCRAPMGALVVTAA